MLESICFACIKLTWKTLWVARNLNHGCGSHTEGVCVCFRFCFFFFFFSFLSSRREMFHFRRHHAINVLKSCSCKRWATSIVPGRESVQRLHNILLRCQLFFKAAKHQGRLSGRRWCCQLLVPVRHSWVVKFHLITAIIIRSVPSIHTYIHTDCRVWKNFPYFTHFSLIVAWPPEVKTWVAKYFAITPDGIYLLKG